MNRGDRIELAIHLVIMAGLLIALGFVLGILFGPKAHADMCGPTPGLPSYSYPWVKSCRLYLPGTGGLVPAIPVVAPPNGVYPVPVVGGTGGLIAPGYQPGSGYTPIPWP
jgi:hypothetical protein